MQQETTQNFGAPLSDTFDNYFSEIENKYRSSESRLQTNKTPGLIIGASAIAVAIFLGGLIWLFTRERSTPVEAITENKPPVIEKSKSNTPPDGMVYVAGREFMMGDDGADEYARPAHRVSVKPFYIDKTEVTCEEYKKFVDATGHPSPLTWQNNNFPAGSAEKPVTGVN